MTTLNTLQLSNHLQEWVRLYARTKLYATRKCGQVEKDEFADAFQAKFPNRQDVLSVAITVFRKYVTDTLQRKMRYFIETFVHTCYLKEPNHSEELVSAYNRTTPF